MSKQSIQRLLDIFKPPDKAGRLKSFSCVTYEFQAEFFETELLPGLFNLGIWQTKGWSSRIALERYLDESYIGVVMEGSCYHSRPSLRIDLATYSAGTGLGKQHAKVYLLHFEDCVRLVVGSANVTESAFRSNRESVVAVDCTPQQPEAAPLIEDAIQGWTTRFGGALPGTMKGALLDAVEACREWKRTRPAKDSPAARFVWGGPEVSLSDEIAKAWPKGESVLAIDVVSPFWSRGDASAPEALLRSLRDAGHIGAAGARLRILADARLDSKVPEPSLPPVLVEWAKGLSGVGVGAVAVDPALTALEREAFPKLDLSLTRRCLHSKLVLLRGSKSSLLYAGSANCTPAGWGIRRGANVEAGLLLNARKPDTFLPLLPPTAGLEIDLAACRPTDVAYVVDETPTSPWPSFLEAAVVGPGPAAPDRLILSLTWRGGETDRPCQIHLTRGSDTLLWEGQTRAEKTDVDLSPGSLETLLIDRELLVRWGTPAVEASFPILVDERAKHSLPLGPNVRLPGEQALLSYYQGRIRWEDLFPEPSSNGGADQTQPAGQTEIDTSRILAYQMREFVEALPGLLAELPGVPREERAVRRSLQGPVSPLALARYARDACRDGRRSGTAALFQLLELQLVLAKTRSGFFGASPGIDQAFVEVASQVEGLIAEVKTLDPDLGAINAFERRVRTEVKKVRQGARQ